MSYTLSELKTGINAAALGDLNALGGVLRSMADGDVLYIGGVQVTATAAELNKLDGAGAVVASGTQAAVIADPSGGATTDAEARTAINAVIDALQAFGIVATS
tara:strand:+ start:2916 stop:3224 length:309 start_codon:yes stop_codon:yes gene_type:complete